MWKDAIDGGEFDGRSSTGAVQAQQLRLSNENNDLGAGREKTRAGDAMQMARIAFVAGGVGMCGSAASLSSGASGCGESCEL